MPIGASSTGFLLMSEPFLLWFVRGCSFQSRLMTFLRVFTTILCGNTYCYGIICESSNSSTGSGVEFSIKFSGYYVYALVSFLF